MERFIPCCNEIDLDGARFYTRHIVLYLRRTSALILQIFLEGIEAPSQQTICSSERTARYDGSRSQRTQTPDSWTQLALLQ